MFKLVIKTGYELEETINTLLNEGWRLYGQPFIYGPDGNFIAQALINGSISSGKTRTISTRKIKSSLPVGQPKQSFIGFPLTGTVALSTDEKNNIDNI
ncbi:MAG: DUF1737 domain-containing protein [Flavobacterium sp.]|uniref:DUF1737 domain-containing protein n=1 Tax=Flavobacterium sp. TaxID=239 RepID=UPI0026263A7D|nr:DUF1737 domain-containing protein [Flavobacterium sp.]MDD5150000.1 DUF1737 domain-containing protein [Flavobacterium sp.]